MNNLPCKLNLLFSLKLISKWDLLRNKSDQNVLQFTIPITLENLDHPVGYANLFQVNNLPWKVDPRIVDNFLTIYFYLDLGESTEEFVKLIWVEYLILDTILILILSYGVEVDFELRVLNVSKEKHIITRISYKPHLVAFNNI